MLFINNIAHVVQRHQPHSKHTASIAQLPALDRKKQCPRSALVNCEIRLGGCPYRFRVEGTRTQNMAGPAPSGAWGARDTERVSDLSLRAAAADCACFLPFAWPTCSICSGFARYRGLYSIPCLRLGNGSLLSATLLIDTLHAVTAIPTRRWLAGTQQQRPTATAASSAVAAAVAETTRLQRRSWRHWRQQPKHPGRTALGKLLRLLSSSVTSLQQPGMAAY